MTLLLEPGGSSGDGLTVSPGTKLGIDHAHKLGKRDAQLCFGNLANPDLVEQQHKVVKWLLEQKVSNCAIGGPRESEAKGIEQKALDFLTNVFQEYKEEMNKRRV